ncbi:MAG: hypothetical protein GX614_05065 [Sandaracinaceae bacterium]|nr:hypothetical protein [Sandaracinaceae bacterium]
MKLRHPVLILPLTALILALASLTPDSRSSAEGRARAGLRLQFATLSSAGGMRGEAFLPISGRDIEISERGERGPCANEKEVRFEAKHPSAYVRRVRVALRGQGDRFKIGGTTCPAALVEAELENGSLLTAGEGEVQVDRAKPGELSGKLVWTPIHGSEPLPFRGNFAFRLPRR